MVSVWLAEVTSIVLEPPGVVILLAVETELLVYESFPPDRVMPVAPVFVPKGWALPAVASIVGTLKVPLVTVTMPVNVLVPDRVRVPAPEVVTAPPPDITLEIAGVSLPVSARIISSLPLLLMAVPPDMVDEPAPDFKILLTVTVWLDVRVKSRAPDISRVSIDTVVWALIEPVIWTYFPVTLPMVVPAPTLTALLSPPLPLSYLIALT